MTFVQTVSELPISNPHLQAKGMCPACGGTIVCERSGTNWVVPSHQVIGTSSQCRGTGQRPAGVRNLAYSGS